MHYRVGLVEYRVIYWLLLQICYLLLYSMVGLGLRNATIYGSALK